MPNLSCPFKLPVRLEDEEYLVAADNELIAHLLSSTPEEREYIVWAINRSAS